MAVVYALIAVKMHSLAVWTLVVLIAVREIGVTLFRTYSLRRYKTFIPANRWGKVKMILSNPETLLNESILLKIKKLTISHFVIDETHTVSEWGKSFRPAYLEIYKIISELHIEVITAFTQPALACKTASDQSINFNAYPRTGDAGVRKF